MASTKTEEPLMICVIDCETGETIYRPFTDEEAKQHAENMKAYEEAEAKRQAEVKALADAKASALIKLAALGLTEEEAKAIVG